jgi:hypothetical protein
MRVLTARLERWRYFSDGTEQGGQLLIIRIKDGPRAVLGRGVHVPVTEADLPVLEGIVAATRARQEGNPGGLSQWYVRAQGYPPVGPVSRAEADERIAQLRSWGAQPELTRVVAC